VAQYIKDLSFESPSILKLIEGTQDDPNLQLGVQVGASSVKPDVYEAVIELKALASNKARTLYDLEIVYGGLFEVKGVPQNQLEPFLLINCPTLIFPFLRRLVADLTREGGFPPLLLDPIDFAQLFMRRMKEQQGAGKPN
jgi:preprotein translocase subunit SecB